MTPIHLIAEDVRRIGREAFLKGELQVNQVIANPAEAAEGCLYAGPCVIGASLTQEQREFLDGFDQPGIRALIESGIITTDEPTLLEELQRAHDAACDDAACDNDGEARTDFTDLLEINEEASA